MWKKSQRLTSTCWTTIIEHFLNAEKKLTSEVKFSSSDPRKFKRTIAKTAPPTKELMAMKKSRFNDV